MTRRLTDAVPGIRSEITPVLYCGAAWDGTIADVGNNRPHYQKGNFIMRFKLSLTRGTIAVMTLMMVALMLVISTGAGAQQPNRVYTSTTLNFSITLPEGWRLSGATTKSETYFDREGGEDDLAACVGTKGANTQLADHAVATIDLSDVKGTTDERTRQAGVPARRINGTAVSEGDPLVVYSIDLKPDPEARIIQLTIWGPPDVMKRASMRREVDLLISSFKPAH